MPGDLFGSGGDASAMPPNNDITPYVPEWLKKLAPMTVPQGMPGQLEGLSRDLAAGGFGSQAANMKALDNIYDPVQTMRWPPAAAPKPKTPTTTTNNNTSTNKPKQYGTGSWYQDGRGNWIEMTRHIPSGRNAR